MAHYNVTVKGYRSPLEKEALKNQIEEQFPQQDVEVSIERTD